MATFQLKQHKTNKQTNERYETMVFKTLDISQLEKMKEPSVRLKSFSLSV
jgi:hypothetical protein